MDAFGIKPSNTELTTADYLDQSAFDEKFFVEPDRDYIENIYHIDNKYLVPVLAGGYREMYEYSIKYLIYPDDVAYSEIMEPDTLMDRLKNSETPGMLKADFREKLIDGSYRWVQYLGIAGKEHGVPEGQVYFYVYDIQNQKDRLEGKSSFRSVNHVRDAITGLRVRELFIPDAIKLTKTMDEVWCCLAIDIQHFKIFNSWFGYEKGDYLLCRIGSYLLGLEESQRLVTAYFGRDNFAVFMRHDWNLIERIFHDIKGIVNSYSNMAGFLPAFGICMLEDGEQPKLDSYDKARLAIEEAKKGYNDRIKYFDSQEYDKTRREYELLSEFQKALSDDEISFYLQPQCRIVTGKIVGVEALARWCKKDGTMISPGVFVPFLESSGFIVELDKRVWQKVCQWLRSLLDRNITPIPVSVNVSQIDLLSMDVAAYLYVLTENYHIPPRLLQIEITESAYAANFDMISETIDNLREKGFPVFLDDFGAGYSSLNMLDKINVDVLKLDMAFLRKDSSLSKKGISIMESILSMSKALEIPVIIEGVENEEQVKFLDNFGCRYAQGYYFYRPMAVDLFEEIIGGSVENPYEGFKLRSTDLFHAKDFLSENLFTDSALNHVLGAVAYYTLERENLTITRFNELFYRAIGDEKMNTRRIAIQNYVVKEDLPMLYQALKDAENNAGDGGICEVRFYKSDNSVFWFQMKFFYLKKEGQRKLFYGQIEDITEIREQSTRFLEVLRKQADVTMKMDLDRNIIQYVTGDHTLYQVDLPSISLDESVRRTAISRIENDKDRKEFIEFFNSDRLREMYRKAIYHETLKIGFKLRSFSEPVEFSTYYIRHSKNQSLTVYAFANKCEKELLEKDPLTGMKNRYSYNEILRIYEEQNSIDEDIIIYSMDVNGLKTTNDTYGHLAGDELIQGAADCITRILSPYGNCFRIGGDEFVAFIHGDKRIAQTLKCELESELSKWKGNYVDTVSISCGYVVSGECPGMSITEMLKFADREMYKEKSRYYQQRGIDRRMQQAAFNALCNSYAKILRVNLTEDKFEIIRVNENELNIEQGYDEKLSSWMYKFAQLDLVHPADLNIYLSQTDIEYLRKYFYDGNKQFSMHYRRKLDGEFRMVIMEIIPTPEYSHENQTVFLYIKDIG